MEVHSVLASFDKVLTFEVTVWLRPTHRAALRVTASLPTYTVPLHCNTRNSLQRAPDARLMCLTGKLILHDRPALEKETEIFFLEGDAEVDRMNELYSNDSFDSLSLNTLSENMTIQTAALVFFMCCSFLASL